MKFAGITPVYNEQALIKGCIMCLQPFVDTHIVVVSENPYFGKAEEPDKTAELAEYYGAEVIKGTWEMDHHQRNVAISLLQDYDWIICTDVDMWMTYKDMETLIKILESAKDVNAVCIEQIAYWKNIETVIDDPNPFCPVIAIKPHVRFSWIGNVDVSCALLKNPKVHHLCWCEPKDIYKKVTTWSHANEFDGKEWYKKHYASWCGGNVVVPAGHGKFNTYKTKNQPLPQELRRFL